MNIADIRRARLRDWFAHRTLPKDEKSYISQLMSGKVSFGEKAARRLEKTYGMPELHLDTPLNQIGAAEERRPYSYDDEYIDLIEAWNMLLPDERSELMADIERRAAHNKAVMQQYIRDSGAKVVNVSERKSGDRPAATTHAKKREDER